MKGKTKAVEVDQRKKQKDDIRALKIAMSKTQSRYLKRDYSKAIKRKKRELLEYDHWHKTI